MDGYSVYQRLPFHPHPFDGESLSSLLMRTASGNGIISSRQFHKIAFPRGHSKISTHDSNLIPRIDRLSRFGKLPELLGISEQRLSSMSLYHYFKNLGERNTAAQVENTPNQAYLRKLRYCPDCVTEYGGYKLIWQIPCVQICDQHKCLLQDRCPCGSLVTVDMPFMGDLTKCPNCSIGLGGAPREVPEGPKVIELLECVFMVRFLLDPDFPARVESGEVFRVLGQKIITFLCDVAHSEELHKVIFFGLNDLMLLDGITAHCSSWETRTSSKHFRYKASYCLCKRISRKLIEMDFETGIIAARYRFLRNIYCEYLNQHSGQIDLIENQSFSDFVFHSIENYS